MLWGNHFILILFTDEDVPKAFADKITENLKPKVVYKIELCPYKITHWAVAI